MYTTCPKCRSTGAPHDHDSSNCYPAHGLIFSNILEKHIEFTYIADTAGTVSVTAALLRGDVLFYL